MAKKKEEITEKKAKHKVYKESGKINKTGWGCPCKITTHGEEILTNIREHFMKEYAAVQAVGICKSTYLNWKNLAVLALEEGREDMYSVFLAQIQEAKALAVKSLTTRWSHHTPNDWRACKELIEKLDPENWTTRQQFDCTSNGETIGKPVFLPMKNEI